MEYAWIGLILMWLCAVPATGQGLNCSLSAWQNLVSDGSVRLRHVINPVSRTVTVEVESNDDSGWLGFGFTNTAKMVGSKAVIGLPRRGAVRKYALNGKSRLLVRRLSTSLTDTLIQSSGGKTVLKYTQLLDDENDDVVIQAGKPVRYLWAQGLFGFLSSHGGRNSGVGSTILANCTSFAA
jgi:DOMON domain